MATEANQQPDDMESVGVPSPAGGGLTEDQVSKFRVLILAAIGVAEAFDRTRNSESARQAANEVLTTTIDQEYLLSMVPTMCRALVSLVENLHRITPTPNGGV